MMNTIESDSEVSFKWKDQNLIILNKKNISTKNCYKYENMSNFIIILIFFVNIAFPCTN